MPFFKTPLENQGPLQSVITKAYRMDETACVKDLLDTIDFSLDIQEAIQKRNSGFLMRKLIARI